jgi:tetratricopeptide (TPR) repeat protein
LEYLKLYKESWIEVQKEQLNDDPSRTIVSTWMISFNKLSRNRPDMGRLLRLWGWLNNRDLWRELLCSWGEYEESIPEWLQGVTKSRELFSLLMKPLVDLYLVEQVTDSDSYMIHTVIHDWIRLSVAMESSWSYFYIAVTCTGLSVLSGESMNSRSLQQRLLPHANYLLEQKPRTKPEELKGHSRAKDAYCAGLDSLGKLYYDQGLLSVSETIYSLALKGRENTLGPEHPSTLSTVEMLGVLYHDQRNLAKAVTMHRRALEGTKKALGEEHQLATYISGNLGNALFEQGRSKDAEKVLKRALEGYRNLPGQNSIAKFTTMSNLGILYRRQGRHEEAEPILKCVLEEGVPVLGPYQNTILNATSNLGAVYLAQNRLAEAEVLFRRALEGYDKIVAPRDQLKWTTQYNYGLVLKKKGELEAGANMFEKALVGYTRVLGGLSKQAVNSLHHKEHLRQLIKEKGGTGFEQKDADSAKRIKNWIEGIEHTSNTVVF